MASNLPPGCRESDIPGSRPEDEAWEKLLDEFHATLGHDEAILYNQLVIQDLVEEAIQFGLDKGRQECELSNKESDFYCSEYLKKEILRAIEEAFSQEPKEDFLK